MNIVTHIISVAVVPLSAAALGKAGGFIAEAAALPDWLTPLIGPVGALTGMIIAIRWLLERLDKAEVKSDQRDEERAKNMAMIATMTLQNQTVIEQNSEVLVEVKNALKTK
jgi:hypothetical protein